jgi:hypothetical protein
LLLAANQFAVITGELILNYTRRRVGLLRQDASGDVPYEIG